MQFMFTFYGLILIVTPFEIKEGLDIALNVLFHRLFMIEALQNVEEQMKLVFFFDI
tara:strand:+ start:588 stop:755 length:168 start_codon:yes stop_codon:yes gene_type:complete